MKPEEWYRELISTITEPDVKRVASILDFQARKKSLDERISALRTAMSAQIRNQGRQLNFWR